MLAQLFLCLFLCSSTADNVNLFFSGGGIRAAFGTLVAMCEIRQQWQPGAFQVPHIVGLSGGAWGVSLLGSTQTMTACDILNHVKNLSHWGKVIQFSPAGCSTWGGPMHHSCFTGWRLDIERWFDEAIPDQHRNKDDQGNKVVDNIYGPTRFGGLYNHTKIWIQTDPCHFGKPPARWANHDGTCVASTTDEHLYCLSDLRRQIRGTTDAIVTTEWSKCQIGDEGRFSTTFTDLTFNKLLAYSSAAWASATAASTGATVLSTLSFGTTGDKTTPLTTCREDGDVILSTQFCDSGGQCNFPLGSLEVMFEHSVFQKRLIGNLQFVAFDYSDNQGDNKDAINQCLEKWDQYRNWQLVTYMVQPWGYTMLMAPKYERNDLDRYPPVILHIVQFRGIQAGDRLVLKFPTVQTISPTHFVPDSAHEVAYEYSNFLKVHLFGATNNPFNRDAAFFKNQLRGYLSKTHIFLEKTSKTSKKKNPKQMQPETN